MSKVILIVWLLASRDTVVMQYAAKFDTEEQCQAAAKKYQDPRAGWRSDPVKFAECVMEAKK